MSTMAAQYSNYQVPPAYATSSTTASPYASQQQAPPPPAQNPMYSSTASQVEHATLRRRRSHSFDATTVASKFDPYASVTANHNQHAPHQYETHVQPGNSFVNGSSQAYGSSFTGAAPPPTYSQFNQMEFTTSGLPSQYDYNNFAQPPPPQQVQQQQNTWNPSSSQTVVSEVTFQTHAATNNNNNFDTSGGDLLGGMTTTLATTKQQDADDEFANVDPKLVAEQERIMQDIQARNKMAQIRKNAGVAQSSHAMVPSSSGGYSGAMVPHNGRGPPTRSRSMPHPGSSNNPKSGIHSIARGGVAVLDPKKDLRKQTRKMKTAGGAVGGAVVGGLVLGPVGVVLGAGGGAAAANKMAKSRDKRKQQKFEQQNFQRGANQSMTRKGDNSFA